MKQEKQADWLHFCAEDGWFGDPMPLYAQGIYHLYYTKRYKEKPDTCWGHLTSRDMLHWTEEPDCLEPDGEEPSLCTGSVVYHNGRYYAFYASTDRHNIYHILSAESEDGRVFRKHRRSLLPEEREGYRRDETWRDPHVFWNPEEQCFWMLFCARRPQERPNTFAGSLGLAKSNDLEHWELCPPLWAEAMTVAPECPDLYRENGRWILLYYWHSTCIRSALSAYGPWKRGAVLSPDHFDFMAGKRLSDGKRTLLFGWIPRKLCDCSERVWGGVMACPRELTVDGSGTPHSRFVPELDVLFSQRYDTLDENSLCVSCGEWSWESRGFSAGASDRAAYAYMLSAPQNYRLTCRMRLQGEHTTGLWLLRLQSSEQRRSFAEPVDEGYMLLFDRADGLLRLREAYQWDQRPDLAAIPWNPREGAFTQVDLLLHNDILEINLDESESLVYRLMKHQDGGLAFCVQDGVMQLQDGVLWTRAES